VKNSRRRKKIIENKYKPTASQIIRILQLEVVHNIDHNVFEESSAMMPYNLFVMLNLLMGKALIRLRDGEAVLLIRPQTTTHAKTTVRKHLE
jgi:hypothetical protein